MKLLEQLAKMQKDLKQEVENNPELKLNTEELTENQKRLEEILYQDKEKNKEETKIEETEETYSYKESKKNVGTDVSATTNPEINDVEENASATTDIETNIQNVGARCTVPRTRYREQRNNKTILSYV